MDRWLAGPLALRDRVAGTVACVTALMGVYSVVAQVTAASAPRLHVLPTPIDAWVPFTAQGVFAYAWLFPQVIAPVVLIQDRRVLLRTALAYTALVLCAVPVWLLWPVTVPREAVPVVDLPTWGLAVVRWIDPPTNCFPSMHVAETFFAAFVVRRHARRLGDLLLGGAVAVWWSTLALAQHWFLDGLAGLVLALVVDRLFFSWRPLPAAAYAGARDRDFGWMLLLYGILVVVFATPWYTGLLTGADLVPRW